MAELDLTPKKWVGAAALPRHGSCPREERSDECMIILIVERSRSAAECIAPDTSYSMLHGQSVVINRSMQHEP